MPTTEVVNVSYRTCQVYIGRGSKWGNRFSWLPSTPTAYLVKDREEAISRYKEWVVGQPALMLDIQYLHGKVLGCYCAPLPCHGDVLAALADAAYLRAQAMIR